MFEEVNERNTTTSDNKSDAFKAILILVSFVHGRHTTRHKTELGTQHEGNSNKGKLRNDILTEGEHLLDVPHNTNTQSKCHREHPQHPLPYTVLRHVSSVWLEIFSKIFGLIANWGIMKIFQKCQTVRRFFQ